MVSAPVHSVAYQFFHWPLAGDGLRKCQTGVIQYLNYDTWEVDWAATYDPVAKTGSGTGTGCQVIDKGEGQGAVTPILVDPVANGSHKVEVVP